MEEREEEGERGELRAEGKKGRGGEEEGRREKGRGKRKGKRVGRQRGGDEN